MKESINKIKFFENKNPFKMKILKTINLILHEITRQYSMGSFICDVQLGVT